MFVFLGYFGTNVCFCKNSCDYFLKRCATFNSNIWSHCVKGHTHTHHLAQLVSLPHTYTSIHSKEGRVLFGQTLNVMLRFCVLGSWSRKNIFSFVFELQRYTYLPRGIAKKVLKITCKWIVLGQSFFNFLSIKQSKLFDSWIIQIGE